MGATRLSPFFPGHTTTTEQIDELISAIGPTGERARRAGFA
jgi:hypothetical protein